MCAIFHVACRMRCTSYHSMWLNVINLPPCINIRHKVFLINHMKTVWWGKMIGPQAMTDNHQHFDLFLVVKSSSNFVLPTRYSFSVMVVIKIFLQTTSFPFRLLTLGKYLSLNWLLVFCVSKDFVPFRWWKSRASYYCIPLNPKKASVEGNLSSFTFTFTFTSTIRINEYFIRIHFTD